ncbi:MAG: hypothetical protein ACFFB3_21170 [Candidatus Hodarchaeota archaeon]
MAKKKEFKVKINFRVKKMTDEEYSVVAGLWKQTMLDFEERLRANLRASRLDYKTFKDLDKGFNFVSLAALDVPLPKSLDSKTLGPEPLPHGQPEDVLEKAIAGPQVEPAPITTSEPPTSKPLETSVKNSVLKAQVVPAESSIYTPMSAPHANEGEARPSLRSLADMAKSPAARPSSPVRAETITRPSPGIPDAPTAEKPAVTAPIEEEDRATGIAILRQQMLSELKKIRGIIETKEQ